MIIGTVDNASTVEVAFPFFTGIAGARDLGDGRLQLAFMSTRLNAIKGEGLINERRYAVEGPASASTVKGMALVIVRALDPAPPADDTTS